MNFKALWAVQNYDGSGEECNKNHNRRIKRKRDEHGSDLEIMDSHDINNKRRKIINLIQVFKSWIPIMESIRK